MERSQNVVRLTILGKKYIVDLSKMKQCLESAQASEHPEHGRDVFKKIRSQLWFYRDRDGAIKPYDIFTVTRITIELEKECPQQKIRAKIGKHDYEIDLISKKQTNINFPTSIREVFREPDLEKMCGWEVTFDNVAQPESGKEYTLTELDKSSDEFIKIQNYFYIHMPQTAKQPGLAAKVSGNKFRDCNKIHKIEKIFNPKLRDQWTFLLRKIREDNNNNDTSMSLTKLLWHGSGDLAPVTIYSDVHYGWKINYASPKNLWGPGLYFGEDASYCHKYSYRTHTPGRRQMFLAEVITGDDIISLEDATIKEPWLKEDGKTRYDSVCGVRHETSWIWVVYASGRAYPAYLVEYEE